MAIITAPELCGFVKDAVVNRWGYVYGGQGQKFTSELAEKWAKRRTRRYERRLLPERLFALDRADRG